METIDMQGAPAGATEEDRDYPGAPRWVKVAGIVAVVVVLVLIAVLAFGGAEHGPGRHIDPGDDDQGADEGDHTRPGDHPAPAPARTFRSAPR